MTEDELSRCAASEQYPDSGMDHDWLAWYKLRDVYRDFRAGRIGRTEGEQTKTSIFRYRQENIDRDEGHRKAYLHLAEFWKRIEQAGSDYMKNPSVETADKFVEAVYGAGRLKR